MTRGVRAHRASTMTTSAPSSLRIRAANGPAQTLVRSSTRRPVSGRREESTNSSGSPALIDDVEVAPTLRSGGTVAPSPATAARADQEIPSMRNG